MQTERKQFYAPEEILAETKQKVEQCLATGQSINYISFVPDGEPTLDINLGREVEMLGGSGIRVAVLTNASLLDRSEVWDDLAKADLVSLKVDAVSEHAWRRVNRPHGSLDLSSILEGICEFARTFRGEIISETMLIDGINDKDDEIRNIAKFLAKIEPSKAYLAIPTRPPAEKWVHAPRERTINQAYQVLSASLGTGRVECLIGYEGNAFASTGHVEEDLLSITSVHPMRREAVEHLLKNANADWGVVERLIEERKLIEIQHEGHAFYMRRIPSRN